MFHPDSVWQVSVSSTKDLNSPNAPYLVIDEATVEIYRGEQLIDELPFRGRLKPATAIATDGTRSDTVIWNRADEYRSTRNIRPEAGIDYTLRVSAPGYPTVTATGRIPDAPSVTLSSARLNPDEGVLSFDKSLEVSGTVRDVPEQNNFYMVGASFQNLRRRRQPDDSYDTTYFREYLFAAPLDVRVVGVHRFSLFSDQSFFGIDYPLVFRAGLSDLIIEEDTSAVTLHLGTIEEAFYRYYETLEAQDNYRVGIVNLTDPPQAYSNVENGLGVFAGYNTVDFKIYREDWE